MIRCTRACKQCTVMCWNGLRPVLGMRYSPLPKWVVLVWVVMENCDLSSDLTLRNVCTRSDYILVYSRPCWKELILFFFWMGGDLLTESFWNKKTPWCGARHWKEVGILQAITQDRGILHRRDSSAGCPHPSAAPHFYIIYACLQAHNQSQKRLNISSFFFSFFSFFCPSYRMDTLSYPIMVPNVKRNYLREEK